MHRSMAGTDGPADGKAGRVRDRQRVGGEPHPVTLLQKQGYAAPVQGRRAVQRAELQVPVVFVAHKEPDDLGVQWVGIVLFLCRLVGCNGLGAVDLFL